MRFAHHTGVSVETLRFYEKRRLLKVPPRSDGGFRCYSDDVVHQVRFIKQAQSLGLTLDDIQQLITGQQRRSHAPSCRKVRDLLTRRIDDIDSRIKELRSFRRTLHEHLVACEQALAATTEPECPTIERSTVRRMRVRSMKHGEKIAPVAAALTGLATLACCLPVGFAAGAVTAGLSTGVAAYQSWFLGASVVLLAVGLVQLNQVQRTCSRRPYASFIVFGVSAVIVLLVVLFPQVIAGMLADWLP